MTKLGLKRVGIGILGSAVVLIGVVMLALPGPGWLTIFAGFGILATEFVFARRLLERTRAAAYRGARAVGVPERWCHKLRLTPGSRRAGGHEHGGIVGHGERPREGSAA